MSSTTTSAATTTAAKRVHLGENEVRTFEHDPLNEDADTWISGEECKQNFRQEVIEYLTEYKRVQAMLAIGAVDCYDDEEAEQICSRGLEMYLPGEIRNRRQVRLMYSFHVLRKYKLFRNENMFESEERRDEELRAFACTRNTIAVRKAHAMALQDAIEARIIYSEDIVPSSEEESSSGSKDNVDFAPLIRHESNTLLTTNKARAA